MPEGVTQVSRGLVKKCPFDHNRYACISGWLYIDSVPRLVHNCANQQIEFSGNAEHGLNRRRQTHRSYRRHLLSAGLQNAAGHRRVRLCWVLAPRVMSLWCNPGRWRATRRKASSTKAIAVVSGAWRRMRASILAARIWRHSRWVSLMPGLHGDLVNRILTIARARDIQIDDLSVDLLNGYYIIGSFIRGDGVGYGEPADIVALMCPRRHPPKIFRRSFVMRSKLLRPWI